MQEKQNSIIIVVVDIIDITKLIHKYVHKYIHKYVVTRNECYFVQTRLKVFCM